MVKPDQIRRSSCPVSCALDILGDRWTLLVVRDIIFKQKRHFGDFLTSPEKIASNILSDRLKKPFRETKCPLHFFSFPPDTISLAFTQPCCASASKLACMENPANGFFFSLLFEPKSGNLNKPPTFAGYAFHQGFMQGFLRRPANFLQ